MRDFREFKVWERAHELALAVYGATRGFPREETYGLTTQMRRACVSIPSNIAEGCGRRTNPDLARFLQIAMGSASELEYQLLLACDLGYLAPAEQARLSEQTAEVKKMLAALIKKVIAVNPNNQLTVPRYDIRESLTDYDLLITDD